MGILFWSNWCKNPHCSPFIQSPLSQCLHTVCLKFFLLTYWVNWGLPAWCTRAPEPGLPPTTMLAPLVHGRTRGLVLRLSGVQGGRLKDAADPPESSKVPG